MSAKARSCWIIAAGVFIMLYSSCSKEKPAATVDEAKAFVEEADKKILELSVTADRANWIQSTYITEDTEILAAEATERRSAAIVELAKTATRFDGLNVPEDVARKLKLIKLSLTLPTPANPTESEELTRIVASMEGTYGKGKYCPEGKKECLDIGALSRILASSRNPKELLEVWQGWRTISPPMRKPFERYVELSNKGARELGFAD